MGGRSSHLRDSFSESSRRLVVQERSAARHFVPEVRLPTSRATPILVVAPAHREADPVAGRNHQAGRPDLDIELGDLTSLEGLRLVVGMVGPMRQRSRRIELRWEARNQPWPTGVCGSMAP